MIRNLEDDLTCRCIIRNFKFFFSISQPTLDFLSRNLWFSALPSSWRLYFRSNPQGNHWVLAYFYIICLVLGKLSSNFQFHTHFGGFFVICLGYCKPPLSRIWWQIVEFKEHKTQEGGELCPFKSCQIFANSHLACLDWLFLTRQKVNNNRNEEHTIFTWKTSCPTEVKNHDLPL